MAEKEISVVIKFRLDRRKESGFLGDIKPLLCEVRQQRGCLLFDLYRALKGRDWFLLETWESEPAFTEHKQTPQAARLRAFLNEHTDWEQWQLEPVMA